MDQPRWRYRRRLETDESLVPQDAAETSRVQRLRTTAIAQDYLHARALMRQLISDCFDVDVHGVRLHSRDDARPFAEGYETIGVSWSRSGPRAFAGLVENGRIGVDVEIVQPREIGAMMRMIATEAESRLVSAISEPERLMAFYRLWCSKEAVLKWRGDGLRGNAKSVDVPAAVISGQLERVKLDDVTLQIVYPCEDCVAAMAFSG